MVVLASVAHVLHLRSSDFFISDLTLILNNVLMESGISVSYSKFLGSLPALEVFTFPSVYLFGCARILELAKIALLHVKDNDLVSIIPSLA